MARVLCAQFILLLTTFLVSKNEAKLFSPDQDPKNIHAVLVSGVPLDLDASNFAVNYAPEAEIAQTYHLLIENGVPADNIILFMNGQIAGHFLNPWRNGLYTDLQKSRNYNQGLKIDYQGEEQVTLNNFLAVLKGDAQKIKGGSGRVLKSNENSRVFISHEGHGHPGFLELNKDTVSAKDLQEAFKEMKEKKMFKELVYYIMACYSGSMFMGLLEEQGSVYAVTAVNPNEQARPNEQFTDEGGKKIYVNTQFGNAWLSNVLTDGTVDKTLDQQYNFTCFTIETTASQYGNVEIASRKAASFEGNKEKKRRVMSRLLSGGAEERRTQHKQNKGPLTISHSSKYLDLKQQLNEKTQKIRKSQMMSNSGPSSKDHKEHEELKKKVKKMEEEKSLILKNVNSIIHSLIPLISPSQLRDLIEKHPQAITHLDCHDKVTKFIFKKCEHVRKSPFFDSFFIPMVNLCEQKEVETSKIIEQLEKHCPQI